MRKLLALVVLLPWFAGCSKVTQTNEADSQQKRFKNMGLVLVVDAVTEVKMEGVVIYDDQGTEIYSSAIVSRRNREIMALNSGRVPLTVRAIWRDNPTPIWGKKGEIDWEGVIAGDYTFPVASRIPDSVLRDIRAHGETCA